MTCPHGACGALVLIADRVDYTDLLAGRRLAKVRHRCVAGHSGWLRVDLGPLSDARPIVRYRHERGRGADAAEDAAAARACVGCQATIPRPRENQMFCTPQCGIRHRRAGGAKVTMRRDEAWAETFAELWNGGASPASIAAALHVARRSVSTYASVLRRRGVALVTRPHGGARVAAR